MTVLTAADWLAFAGHFLLLSLLAIGGAIGTAPEMHRVLVGEHGWLTDGQFTTSIALAQAAPGPNLLFVPVIGYQVAGLPGAAVALVCMLVPSTTLTLAVVRLGRARQDHPALRAFVAGMAPVTLGLLATTAWVLLAPMRGQTAALGLAAVAAVASWRTRIGPVWLVAAGAAGGALGWI